MAEIAKEQPHLRQKDIAEKMGITVQAVSENIKSLVDDGLVETGIGNTRYKITKRGIEKVKTEADAFRAELLANIDARKLRIATELLETLQATIESTK